MAIIDPTLVVGRTAHHHSPYRAGRADPRPGGMGLAAGHRFTDALAEKAASWCFAPCLLRFVIRATALRPAAKCTMHQPAGMAFSQLALGSIMRSLHQLGASFTSPWPGQCAAADRGDPLHAGEPRAAVMHDRQGLPFLPARSWRTGGFPGAAYRGGNAETAVRHSPLAARCRKKYPLFLSRNSRHGAGRAGRRHPAHQPRVRPMARPSRNCWRTCNEEG